MTETTGTDRAPSEAPITPPPPGEQGGYEDVSGGETSPPSGAPAEAEEKAEDDGD
jgi:hypothetical protein